MNALCDGALTPRLELATFTVVSMGRIEDYVICLIEEILGENAERGKRFPWAVGDVSPKTSRRAKLPFDGFWKSRGLIVEVDESQHRQPVEFWDKPDVMTVSNVDRGEQRLIYDRRKRAAARAQSYKVIEIPWERRPPPARRDRAADRDHLAALLKAAGVIP